MIIGEKISFDTLDKLIFFFNKNKNLSNSFRYYNKRNFDVIKNHLETILYYKDSVCVGYGHLDKEDNKIWLGIMVDSEHQNLGYGSLIMDDLLSRCNQEIYLSVDKDNKNAIILYKKKLFVIIEEKNNHYIMKLKR